MDYRKVRLTNKIRKSFWIRVDKNGALLKKALGHCWVMRKFRHPAEILKNGNTVLAYRIQKGKIPTNKIYICHHCDNRSCVRGSHLYAGTHQENMRDFRERGAKQRRIRWWFGIPGAYK